MKLIERIISVAAASLMFGLMVLTLVDVIGRNVFNHPLRGATELTEIALVVLSFLLFPVVALAGKNIVADVADVFESRLLDMLRDVLTAILGAVFFGLVAWRLWVLAEQASAYRDSTVSLHISLAPILYVISVLAGVAAVAFLLPLRSVGRRRAPSGEVPSDSVL